MEQDCSGKCVVRQAMGAIVNSAGELPAEHVMLSVHLSRHYLQLGNMLTTYCYESPLPPKICCHTLNQIVMVQVCHECKRNAAESHYG